MASVLKGVWGTHVQHVLFCRLFRIHGTKRAKMIRKCHPPQGHMDDSLVYESSTISVSKSKLFKSFCDAMCILECLKMVISTQCNDLEINKASVVEKKKIPSTTWLSVRCERGKEEFMECGSTNQAPQTHSLTRFTTECLNNWHGSLKHAGVSVLLDFPSH